MGRLDAMPEATGRRARAPGERERRAGWSRLTGVSSSCVASLCVSEETEHISHPGQTSGEYPECEVAASDVLVWLRRGRKGRHVGGSSGVFVANAVHRLHKAPR